MVIYALFVFRLHQWIGVKKKLILFCHRDIVQMHFIEWIILFQLPSSLQCRKIPLDIFSIVSICCQVYLVTKHFCNRLSRSRQLTFFFKMTIPVFSIAILAIPVAEIIYPVYNKQNKEGRLIIALFAPLIGVLLKVFSRICVQRLWNITHPGYSYALLAPLYWTAALYNPSSFLE